MTTSAPTDRIMMALRIIAPGATDDLLKQVLFDTVDDFFRSTNTWRVEDTIQLDTGLQEYPWTIPPDARVVRLMQISHNNVPMSGTIQPGSGVTFNSLGTLLPEQTFPDGDALFGPSETDLAGGTFTYAIYRPDYLSINSLPTTEQVRYPIKAVLALSIAQTCLECDCGDWNLPDWMYDHFYDCWLNGTKHTLHMMPAKPWTSEKLAAYCGRRYRVRKGFHKQEAERGYVYGQPSWRFPRANL